MRLVLYAPEHLKIPITTLKGIGQKQAEELALPPFRFTSVQDLLQHYPRRHLDFSEIRSIKELREGDEVTVIGKVHAHKPGPPHKPKIPLKIVVTDPGGSSIDLVFFNQPWRMNQLRPGTLLAAKGKVTSFKGRRQMTAPMVDVITDADEVVHIVPVYPATAKLHTATLRRLIRSALDKFTLDDPMAPALLQRHKLSERTWAMRHYHFPDTMAEKALARRRLVFDELFSLQVGLAYRKRRIELETIGISHKVEADLATKFLEVLPFDPTAAQRRAIGEIEADMARNVPMHRLLQGEVGSGKTVVALHAALVAVQGGYQAAIMAPTEVLANQHFITVTKLLAPLAGHPDVGGVGQMDLFGGPEAVLITGSTPAARKREALAKIADGSAAIVIGTHALIQEGVEFANLGLAIIDEQHRFGVRQRVVLKEKAGDVAPDVLIMTATPIPRTLAFTLYGDLDVSVLDELPKGRMPVTTRVINGEQRKIAYDLIRSEVAAGRQAYVITPLIEESDKLEIRSVIAEAERLKSEVFPELRVEMMHGRMSPKDKQAVMDAFRNGSTDVLISTTVVEVGVDVPNATVMVIEDADRFGLSQLHQLRGRIGRGEHSSTCLLIGPLPHTDDFKPALTRLEAMEKTADGFELAALDLELRGSGTILGERQAGFSDLRLTHLQRDVELLKAARDEAFALIDEDHDLSRHPAIRLEMEGRFADRLEWLLHS